MRRDLHDYIKVESTIPAQTITTTPINGTIIDTQGFDILEFSITAFTGTGGTFTPSFVWGNAANLSDAVTIPASNLIGTIAGVTFNPPTTNQQKNIGIYLTTYRYVRMTITGTNTPSFSFSAFAIKSSPYLMPTA